MKRNIADLIRVGILVPALVVTMVGCGTATAKGADAKAEEETVAAEEAKPAEEAAPAAEDKVYENKGFKVTVPGELADKITVQTPDDNDDGVIFGAPDVDSGIIKFCEGLKIPTLPFDGKSMEDGSYIDEYDRFYQELR